MFSNKTLLEITKIIDKLNHSEIDRIISFFNFSCFAPSDKAPVHAKANKILTDLRYSKKSGPYSDNSQLDLLQYLIDNYFDNSFHSEDEDYVAYNSKGPATTFKNAFSHSKKELANSLKRDGYIIEGKVLKKLLPEEIEEAKIESELMSNLDAFGFSQSKGHLSQAILNHSQGNWAAANSQFRPFVESLLVEISNRFVPANEAKTFSQAVKLLTESVTPSFFSLALNEIPKDKESDSFVYGLWVRLHPGGSHPGLSDEDDCSFRYHITIVFANYLLRRLTERRVPLHKSTQSGNS